jgi:hypothetical protein
MIPVSMPPIRISALPTPRYPSRNITIAAENRPSYIASQIKFPGANVSAFQNPEKIQEIQMSLACALRLPLEKIRITNVTTVDIRGLRIIIDTIRFMLSSNGSIRCYTLDRTARGLRRLQGVGSTEANVDYYIVEPSVEILSLTAAEFSNIVQTSSALADLSASVGSTGVVAVSDASDTATRSPDVSASASSNTAATIGGVIGGIVVAAIGIAVVAGFTRSRKQNQKHSPLTRSSIVHVIHTSNPIGGGPSSVKQYMGGSARSPIVFAATKTRSSV